LYRAQAHGLHLPYNVARTEETNLDADVALQQELETEDTPPRRPEALWPEVAPRSDPADVPGTDPDRVDQRP
jgi:hypothetical protein